MLNPRSEKVREEEEGENLAIISDIQNGDEMNILLEKIINIIEMMMMMMKMAATAADINNYT